MRHRHHLTTVAALSALLVAGCSSSAEPEGFGGSGAGPETELLAEHDLDGRTPVEIIDHLETLEGEERPSTLMASVRPDELLLIGSDGTEVGLELPGDRFYVSIAPYVQQTHECFYHSLTTCQGELAGQDVDVRITDDETGEVLVEETRTVEGNGFVGFWLPRDLDGTLEVDYDGLSAEADLRTDAEAPTCVTTLQLT